MAQEPASTAATRPLKLALPHDAIWSSTVRPDPASSDLRNSSASDLPDLGSRTSQRGRMPYGSGYEARQRSTSRSDSGKASGMGGGQGGRGMGRGR
jgi:hypothetical protein